MQSGRFLKHKLVLGSLAASMLAFAGNAGAVSLVGLGVGNTVSIFDSATPSIFSASSITGLNSGESLLGIDLRPSDNTIYGVGSQNGLYTLNPFTGAATFQGLLTGATLNPSLSYGIDFNPGADFAGNTSLRLVSTAGTGANNFAVNVTTKVIGNTAGANIGSGYSGVAYTNSAPGVPVAAAAENLFYINTGDDTLRVATGSFNAPTITTVGALGLTQDIVAANGFEIVSNGTISGGTAFASLTLVDGLGSLTKGLYSIDLGTGAASFIGGTGNTSLNGLTLAPVSEPSEFAMLATSLLAMGAVARRRKDSKQNI